jgi:hypothetical protein
MFTDVLKAIRNCNTLAIEMIKLTGKQQQRSRSQIRAVRGLPQAGKVMSQPNRGKQKAE